MMCLGNFTMTIFAAFLLFCLIPANASGVTPANTSEATAAATNVSALAKVFEEAADLKDEKEEEDMHGSTSHGSTAHGETNTHASTTHGSTAHGETDTHASTTHGSSAHGETDGHGEASLTSQADGPVFLLGGITFIMGIFYFVHARSPVIRRSTWTMLNLAVSIFLAVLYNSFWDKITQRMKGVNEESAHHAQHEPIYPLVIELLVWWISFAFVGLYYSRKVLLQLKGWGIIGGHIIGFAAINLFGNIAQMDAFRASPWGTLLVVLIFLVVMSVLLFASNVFANYIGKQLEEEEAEQWHEQSEETAMDFVCLCGGFLISLWIRFLILGHVPPVHGSHAVASDSEVFQLCAASVTLLVLCAVVSVFHHSFGRAKTLAAAVTNFVAHCLSNAAAYCLLFTLTWNFSGSLGHTLMSKAVVAFASSVVTMLFIVVVSLPVHFTETDATSLRGVFSGLSLCVGLSWEHAFNGSIEELTEALEDQLPYADKQWTIIGFTAVLVLITFPAWMAYILPKGDEHVAHKYKGKRFPWYAAWLVDADSDLECLEEDPEQSGQGDLLG